MTDNNVLTFTRKPEDYFTLGVARAKAGDSCGAMRYFNLAETGGLDTYELHIQIAIALKRSGRYRDSNLSLIRAFQNPKERSYEVNVLMAENYVSLCEYMQARICALRAIESDDDYIIRNEIKDIDALFAMVPVTYDIGTMWPDADTHEPEDDGIYMFEAFARLNAAISAGDNAYAAQISGKIEEYFPDSEFAFPYHVLLLMLSQNSDEAAKLLSNNSPSDKYHNFPMYLLVMVLRFCVRHETEDDELSELYDVAVSCVKKDDTESAILAVQSIMFIQKYAFARRLVTVIRDKNPNSLMGCRLCAACDYALGNYSEAKKAYSELAAFSPNDIVAKRFMELSDAAKNGSVPSNDEREALINSMTFYNADYPMLKSTLTTIENFFAISDDSRAHTWISDANLRNMVLTMLMYVNNATQSAWLRSIATIRSEFTVEFFKECLLSPELDYTIKSQVLTLLKQHSPQETYAVTFGLITVEGRPDAKNVFDTACDNVVQAIELCQKTLRKYHKTLCAIAAHELWTVFAPEFDDLSEQDIAPLAAAVAFKACLRCGIHMSAETVLYYFGIKRDAFEDMMAQCTVAGTFDEDGEDDE